MAKLKDAGKKNCLHISEVIFKNKITLFSIVSGKDFLKTES